MKRIKDIYGLFIGLLGLHYFYSFLFLNKYFECLGLNAFRLITMEDITFSMGIINYDIISLSLIGFIWIYGWRLVVTDEDEVLQNSKNFFSKAWQKFISFIGSIKFFRKVSQNTLELILYFLFLFIFATILLSYLKRKLEIEPDFPLYLMFFLIFVVIPFLYIIFKSRRDIIFMGYIGFIILWGILFINTGIQKIETSKSPHVNEISFEFKGTFVQSNEHYRFVFSTYKYIIMKNDSVAGYDLFPVNDIGKILFKQK